jgi:hypothetical protein
MRPDAWCFAARGSSESDAYSTGSARTTAEVLAPRGSLIGRNDRGAGQNVRVLTWSDFEAARAGLMAGSRAIEADPSYNGVWYQRQDGTRFGLRISSEHGLTLDVIRSDHPVAREGVRFHQR